MAARHPVRAFGDRGVRDRVAAILDAVEAGGDQALIALSLEIDGIRPELHITPSANGVSSEDDGLFGALDLLGENIRAFAQRQMACTSELEFTSCDAIMGHRRIPVHSVGVYLPGGAHRLLTSAQMAAVVAREAGVSYLVMCTPPTQNAKERALLERLAWQCRIDELHMLGGPQAIAAMAFGAESVTAVDMIVGPGGPWVQEAKRQVFGICGIDQIAGPTELVVMVDSTTPLELVAVDAVAQCEHGATTSVIVLAIALVDSELTVLTRHIDELLASTPNSAIAQASWDANGGVRILPTLDAAIETVNAMAPEHVQIMTDHPGSVLKRLTSYGAAFLGPLTTTALGDKGIGPNHILPTNRTARFGSGLSVSTFLRFPTHAALLATARAEVVEAAATVAAAEGLFGHAEALEARLGLLRQEVGLLPMASEAEVASRPARATRPVRRNK